MLIQKLHMNLQIPSGQNQCNCSTAVTLPAFNLASFEELLALFAEHIRLTALDVGMGGGDFCRALARQFPERFDSITGVDVIEAAPRQELVGETVIELRYGTPVDALIKDQSQHGRFNLVFFNSPSDRIWPDVLDTVHLLLGNPGFIISTCRRHQALGFVFQSALDEPHEIRAFHEEICQTQYAVRGYETCVIDNHRAYPVEAVEEAIEGLIVARYAGKRTG